MFTYLKILFLLVMTLELVGGMLPAQAQIFSSDSTGADGPFNPTANVTVQLPANGVFNYSTVTIPSGVTVTYIRNALNTPVTMLATGDVVINGTINISGGNGSNSLTGGNAGAGMNRSTPGQGGPGGFDGGGGGAGQSFLAAANGVAGDGPGGGGGGLGDVSNGIAGYGGGGGFATPGQDGDSTFGGNGKGGPTYGSPTLLQLIGGSGGGGGGARFSTAFGYAGGGGGGAIVIASSTTINCGGTIDAHGGSGGVSVNCGSGGAVRLVANTLAGGLTVYINSASQVGGNGYARFEAFNFNDFSPNIVLGLGTVTTGLPSSVSLPNPPSLQITSVGGVATPSAPKGDFNAQPDITLAANAPNPAVVTLTAANIPVGTVISVEMSPEQGDKLTTSSTALTGTTAASTATASVTLPQSLVSVLYASALIDLSALPHSANPGAKAAQTPPLMLNGELVKKVEVAATFGGRSDVIYITTSGKHYSRAALLGAVPVKVAQK